MPPHLRGWAVALALLCVASLWVQFRHIDATLPYPRNIDEGFVSGPASRTVSTGTLHPYTFNYPSLPKYLAAAGMAAGFLRGATHREVRLVGDLGNLGFPYYDTPVVMRGARQLFVVLAAVALAATGVAAWLAFREPAAVFLAPLLLVLCPLFFDDSWSYLNVDIVGTCFVVLTVAACLQGTRKPSVRWLAVVPAVFAGMATGSKYTLALVIAPVLLAIGLYMKPGRRLWPWLAALALMVLAFVAVVPYSLIDIPGFLNGVGFEAFHYAGGHLGSGADPGWPQFLYYMTHFGSEIGVGGAAAALFGAVAYGITDWRRALTLLAYPAALLWLLASQRTHFERNMLSLLPIAAMFAAYGLIVARRRAFGALTHLATERWSWDHRALMWLNVALTAVLMAAIVPFWHAAGELGDGAESRNAALQWLETRLPSGWRVVVPSQLGFDVRPLEAEGIRVDVINVHSPDDIRGLTSTVGPAVVLLPHWGADTRYPDRTSAALNDAARNWPLLKTFGTNDVLVNYSSPTPSGDPAFGIAAIGALHGELR